MNNVVSRQFVAVRFVTLLALMVLVASFASFAAQHTAAQQPTQRTFESPGKAAAAMFDAAKSGDTNAFLVRFSTKEGQQKLRSVVQGTRFLSKDVGAAWIDQKTFRVRRLQRQSLNLPSDLTRSMTTADYGPVTIGDAEFWIPSRVRSEVTERDTTLTVRYEAEYTDCKKFTAEIKISP